jgi:hypothetical protein
MARAIGAVPTAGAIQAVRAAGPVRLIGMAQAVGAVPTGDALQAARFGWRAVSGALQVIGAVRLVAVDRAPQLKLRRGLGGAVQAASPEPAGAAV